MEKRKILDYLLENYNAGRKKTFFCLAVNLLELSDLKTVLCERKADKELECLSLSERAASLTKRLHEIAGQRHIILKLRKE